MQHRESWPLTPGTENHPSSSLPLLQHTPAHLRRLVHTGGHPHLYNQAPSTVPSPTPHMQSPLSHHSGLGVQTPAMQSTFKRTDPGKRLVQTWEIDSEPAGQRILGSRVWEHGYSTVPQNSLLCFDGNVL